MAEKKPAKVFDVASPGKGKIDIGSKPMIIGHKTMAADPMMRAKTLDANDNDKGAPPIKKSPSEVKVKIEPVSADMKSPESSADSATELSDDAAAVEVSTLDKGPAVYKSASDKNSVEDVKSPEVSKYDDSEKDVHEDTATARTKSTNSKSNDVAEADGEQEEKPSSTDTSRPNEETKKSNDNKLDPAVVAMERAENLQKLIDSKQYRLDIHETSAEPGSQRKIVIALTAILVLLLGLYALVDMKVLDIGVDVPVSLFNDKNSDVTQSTTEGQQASAQSASGSLTASEKSNTDQTQVEPEPTLTSLTLANNISLKYDAQKWDSPNYSLDKKLGTRNSLELKESVYAIAVGLDSLFKAPDPDERIVSLKICESQCTPVVIPYEAKKVTTHNGEDLYVYNIGLDLRETAESQYVMLAGISTVSPEEFSEKTFDGSLEFSDGSWLEVYAIVVPKSDSENGWKTKQELEAVKNSADFKELLSVLSSLKSQ